MYEPAIYANLSTIVPMNEYALHLTDVQKQRVIDMVDDMDNEFRRKDRGYYLLHADENGFTFEGSNEVHTWEV